MYFFRVFSGDSSTDLAPSGSRDLIRETLSLLAQPDSPSHDQQDKQRERVSISVLPGRTLITVTEGDYQSSEDSPTLGERPIRHHIRHGRRRVQAFRPHSSLWDDRNGWGGGYGR